MRTHEIGSFEVFHFLANVHFAIDPGADEDLFDRDQSEESRGEDDEHQCGRGPACGAQVGEAVFVAAVDVVFGVLGWLKRLEKAG